MLDTTCWINSLETKTSIVQIGKGLTHCISAGFVGSESKIAQAVIRTLGESDDNAVVGETHDVEYHKAAGTVTFTVHASGEITQELESNVESVDEAATLV